MTTHQKLRLVLTALADLKAHEVRHLDVRDRTSVTDIMVFATGTSDRHVSSIADNVLREARAAGVRPIGSEGLRDGDWALVDFGDVVVHVMQPKVRDFYGLERLWSMPAEVEE